MKYALVGTLLILALECVGKTTSVRTYIGNTDSVSLQNDRALMEVAIAYPMPDISGVCSLDVIADSYNSQIPIEKILERVEFLKLYDNEIQGTVISRTVIRFNLNEGSFLDGISVRTKNGGSLKKVIDETLGADRKLVIMPRSCL